jgi:hypothetical protein
LFPHKKDTQKEIGYTTTSKVYKVKEGGSKKPSLQGTLFDNLGQKLGTEFGTNGQTDRRTDRQTGSSLGVATKKSRATQYIIKIIYLLYLPFLTNIKNKLG